jgi:hypothetical protein
VALEGIMSTGIPLWLVLSILAAVVIADWAWGRFRDQYEVAWHGRLPRLTRRWYGTGARIRSRDMARFPDIYEVLEWGDDSTDVPWLAVRSVTDEDAERVWVPVTAFAAFQVRGVWPHWVKLGGHRVPALTGYRTLPGPDRIYRTGNGA